jgi:transposase
MIRYEQFLQLRRLFDEEHCTAARVADVMDLNIKTVLKWAPRLSYEARSKQARPSCLDPYKSEVTSMLHQHPYSAQQLLQHIRQLGYPGGYSILKAFVREVRPKANKAYIALSFPPGDCAQIDWGYAGPFTVGSTRRRLSFLVLVLGHSRRMYVEFTLAETMEHFLAVQQNAFRFWSGAPKRLIIDNLKTAVLSHPRGQPAVYNPRYLDFTRHYGCTLQACNVRAAHEKGRVENGVGYVKKNFLNGRDLSGSLAALNALARQWIDEVADVRIHGETKRRPVDLFLGTRWGYPFKY